ncbi:DUF6053 domain-containing protein [Lysobacter enzymogenes]
MGGPSGPTLCRQVAAIRPENVGPEGPPTKAGSFGLKALPQKPEASD